VDPNAFLDSLDKRYKYLAPVWNRNVTYVTLAGSLAAILAALCQIVLHGVVV
jgi:hypothetical protein